MISEGEHVVICVGETGCGADAVFVGVGGGGASLFLEVVIREHEAVIGGEYGMGFVVGCENTEVVYAEGIVVI